MRKVAILILFIMIILSAKVVSAAPALHHPGPDISTFPFCGTCHPRLWGHPDISGNNFVCDNCHGAVPKLYSAFNRTNYLSPSKQDLELGRVVKYDSTTNQKIHSSYSSNTDACASCHTTHTAVGTDLLKWTNIASTCIACHDGTVTTTYNVKAGTIGATGAKTSGGLFGVTETKTEPGLSNHNYLGVVSTGAAPGGNQAEWVFDRKDNYGVWNIMLDCVACHEPHGLGGNSRILSPDPNGIALQNKVVGGSLTAVTANVEYSSPKQDWLKGYKYTPATNIYVGGSLVSTGYTINYLTGHVIFSPALTGVNIVTADYVPALIVQMQVNNKLAVNESVTYTNGMNKFCGACHTDYDTSAQGAASGHTLTGLYRTAYRHGVGMTWNDGTRGTAVVASGILKFEGTTGTSGTIMCLTCHFAHGTDDEFINNGVTTDTAIDPTIGIARSTALKRQVNMGLCETCHQK